MASDNGAKHAGRVVLRLPHSVKELFSGWLRKEFPDRADKILNRIMELRGGKLYDSKFGTRLTGEGIWADTIKNLFESNCRKYGLNTEKSPMQLNLFKVPDNLKNNDQYDIFG
ncbi:MAG: hypothetical protein IPP52_06760 [Ignavibacteria bacterium]|nr:hypothetical protein [Ignavibacteria bacterium]